MSCHAIQESLRNSPSDIVWSTWQTHLSFDISPEKQTSTLWNLAYHDASPALEWERLENGVQWLDFHLRLKHLICVKYTMAWNSWAVIKWLRVFITCLGGLFAGLEWLDTYIHTYLGISYMNNNKYVPICTYIHTYTHLHSDVNGHECTYMVFIVVWCITVSKREGPDGPESPESPESPSSYLYSSMCCDEMENSKSEAS